MMIKVYLAGFDVFYPDAVMRGNEMKRLCEKAGLCGCYPLDNEADSAQEIFRGNTALIDQCDVIAANLNPFRGQEMDSGTAFEIGYAFAKGKKIYGYLDDCSDMVKKLGAVDTEGFHVEDFGMPVNLMIGCCTKIVKGSFSDCVNVISDELLG